MEVEGTSTCSGIFVSGDVGWRGGLGAYAELRAHDDGFDGGDGGVGVTLFLLVSVMCMGVKGRTILETAIMPLFTT